MIKLHLFTDRPGTKMNLRCNPMEMGHLYSDKNNKEELEEALMLLKMPLRYIQTMNKLCHYDLWGKPLEKAKQLYAVVTNSQLKEDISNMKRQEQLA